MYWVTGTSQLKGLFTQVAFVLVALVAAAPAAHVAASRRARSHRAAPASPNWFEERAVNLHNGLRQKVLYLGEFVSQFRGILLANAFREIMHGKLMKAGRGIMVGECTCH